MQRIIRQLIPFLFIGMAVVAFVFGLVLLFYLFLFGALVGAALFVMSWIKNTFFNRKPPAKPKHTGRIIDSDEWNQL